MSWLIWTLLVGLVAGGIARAILPGKQNIGIVGTIAAGVIGSFIGLLIAAVVPFFDHRELSGLIFNVAGAALTLVAFEKLGSGTARER